MARNHRPGLAHRYGIETWEALTVFRPVLPLPCSTSGAEMIRQLLAQATSDTLPAGWSLRVAEHHIEQARPV
jgi:hypothetical protein